MALTFEIDDENDSFATFVNIEADTHEMIVNAAEHENLILILKISDFYSYGEYLPREFPKLKEELLCVKPIINWRHRCVVDALVSFVDMAVSKNKSINVIPD